MLRYALLTVAALSLTAAGCHTSHPDDAPPVPRPLPLDSGAPGDGRVRGLSQGTPLQIPLGQTVARDGHAIRFVEVVEDSRCPQGVPCVWAGRAQVAMEIDGTPVTLSVPHGAQQDGEPSSVEVGTIAVEVVGLDPYPGSPEAGATRVVRAIMRGANP